MASKPCSVRQTRRNLGTTASSRRLRPGVVWYSCAPLPLGLGGDCVLLVGRLPASTCPRMLLGVELPAPAKAELLTLYTYVFGA